MIKHLVVVSLLATGSGCAVRSADVYARDTGAVLATKNDAIQACYNGVLKTMPSAAGKVTVTFDVATDGGRISHVAVASSATTAPQPVADCVTQNLTGLAVTPPDTRTGKGTWVYEFAAGAIASNTPPAAATTQ